MKNLCIIYFLVLFSFSCKQEILGPEKALRTLQVLPNPFSDDFTIHFTGRIESKFSYELYNLNGAVVTQGDFEVHSKEKYAIEITPVNLIDGVYFLRVFSDDSNIVRKLVYRK